MGIRKNSVSKYDIDEFYCIEEICIYICCCMFCIFLVREIGSC